MPVAKTDLELKLLRSLRRIAAYHSPESLHRHAEKSYGCSGEEAVEMAYENVISDAKNAVKGVRVSSAK